MSSRFEYRPLVLALLALQTAPAFAQEAVAPAADAAAAPAPVAPEAATPIAAPTTATELQTITVQAQAEVPYKADAVSSPKFTQPLVDTPQTITVIKKEILQEQGAVSLMEALRNTPGITMQMGENGNTSQGDTFQMRGFSTQTSTFVDGIRDLGAITRDTFNLESIEVAKGPAGADIGRGSASGYINLVTKVPSLDEAASASYTVGTGDKNRLTLDVNRKLNDSSAFRINALQQQSGVDDRYFVENNTVAIAPSIAFGLGTPTRVYAFAQHITQNNVPDGGIPTIGMDGYYVNPSYNHDNASGTPNQQTPAGDVLAAAYMNGAKVNRKNFYGSAWDYEKAVADMVTLKFEHDLGEGAVLTNSSRYGQTRWERVITGINGPSLSQASVASNNPADPATWTLNRSVQGTDQRNEIIANTTNLSTAFKTGALEHALATGVELAIESQVSNTITGGSAPAANLYNPNPYDAFVKPSLTGAYSEGETRTLALYAFDTIKINEFFDINAGLRADRYKTETFTNTSQALLKDSDTLLSWKVGALFKPAENGSVYAAYATSQTPPGSANFSLATGANSASNAKFDPQETTNYEVGTKWNVLNERLALTAAVYRTDNTNEITYDPISLVYTQEGKTRVEGIELGAAGQITSAWQVSAGVAFMDTEVLENRTTTANNAGNAIRWSPEVSGTVWTTYKLSNELTVGGGARYMGEQKRVVTSGANLATQNMPVIPAYWVLDAMASYQFMKGLTVRGNLYNVLDEEYISVLNNGGSRMTLGAPVSASLTLDFQF